MSNQSPSFLKQSKFTQKRTKSITDQLSLMDNETNLKLQNYVFQSPLSGQSNCVTTVSQSQKLIDIGTIKEETNQNTTFFSNVDQTCYSIQNIQFTNDFEIQNAIGICKKKAVQLIVPVKEFILDLSTFTLQIITSKLESIMRPITLQQLCHFLKLLIQSDLTINFDDVVQYLDGSLHINPKALIQPTINSLTISELLNQFENIVQHKPELQLIKELIQSYQEANALKLAKFQVFDTHIKFFQQTLLNNLLRKQF